MFPSKPSNSLRAAESPSPADGSLAPEGLHRRCWYGRRTDVIPVDLALHTTIEDGYLLYCAHPMWLPVVGVQFDVRNCARCEYFKPVRAATGDCPS
jgi:hypothetical protein